MTVFENVPNGWKVTSLGAVVSPSDKKVDPKTLRNVPYVGLEHIEKDTGKLISTGISSDVTSTKAVFEKGDLLYGKLRPYLNKVWVAEFNGVCSTDILVFPQSLFALNTFLFYRLLSGDFVRYAHQNSTGVNHPRTSFKAISNFQFLLPPPDEQQRIVARIEELFTQLDAGVAALEAVRGQVRRYRQAVLNAAVRGELSKEWRVRNISDQSVNLERLIPNGWQWKKVKEVGKVQLGRQRAPQHHNGPFMRPYLRVANVFEDRIDTADVLMMNFTPEEFEIYKLKFGDILLNEGQSPELLGRPAMYRDEVPGACFQNTLIRFQASSGLMP